MDETKARSQAEAAAWLARLQGPLRSEDSDRAFRTWLEQDEANRAAFEHATEIWEMISGAGAANDDREAVDVPAQPSRRGMIAMAASVAAVAMAGGGYWWTQQPSGYETAVGGQQIVRLDDGSRVSLNTDSRIEVSYTRGQRLVRLTRGEALFEVAHDASRPFIVDAGDERVRALGTIFVVRRDLDRKTAVTLIEGRVEISGGKADVGAARPRIAVLAPGERIVVTPSNGSSLDRPAIDTVTAWQRGEVVFEDASLLDVAQELNRYSPTRFVIADPSLGSLRVSGVFSTSDPGEVAQAIAELHHLRARRAGEEIRLTRD